MDEVKADDSTPKPKAPWHQNVTFMVVALLTVGPLALPLVWMNKNLNLLSKVAVTVLMVFLTLFIMHWSAVAIERFQEDLAQLKELLNTQS